MENKFLKYSLMFFLLTLPFSGVVSQDLETDFGLIAEAWEGLDSLKAKISVKTESKGASGTVQMIELQKKGRLYLYKIGESLEILNGEGFFLKIDRKGRDMTIQERAEADEAQVKEYFTPDIRKVFQKAERVVYRGGGDRAKHYDLYFPGNAENEPFLRLYLNMEGRFIKRLVYDYGVQKITVDYLVFVLGAKIPDRVFSLEKYLSPDGKGGWSPSPAYKMYRLSVLY